MAQNDSGLIYFPIRLMQFNRSLNIFAPTVQSLSTSQVQSPLLVLTDSSGTSIAGAYYLVSNTQWKFLIDYKTLCTSLFSSTILYAATLIPGSTVIPVGTIPQGSIVQLFKNGIQKPTPPATSLAGILLDHPATSTDVYFVMIKDGTGAGVVSVGGITDAPMDNNPYVRLNGMWVSLQSWLDEQTY